MNENVKITGKVRGESIFVANVDVMKGQRYQKAWNWDDRVRALRVPR